MNFLYRHRMILSVIFALAGLTTIGLLSLASAESGSSNHWVKSQGIAFAIGWVLAIFVFFFVHPWKWKWIPTLLYGSGLIGLAAVISFGVSIAGHKSWIHLGPLSLQPSEWAKVVLIVMLAFRLSYAERKHLAWYKILFDILLYSNTLVVLVLAEKDLGTSLLLIFTMIGAIAAYPFPKKALVLLALLAVGTAVIGTHFLSPYQKARIETVLHPGKNQRGSGYQVTQAKIAIGSGQFWGKGYQQGHHHQLHYLPARHSDFIFCVWAEEWGFAGNTVLLLLYTLLIGTLFKLGQACSNREGTFMALLTGWNLVIHVGINLGGVMGMLPMTGVPLPFMSYGGSAVISNFILIGLALAATRAPMRLKDIRIKTVSLHT